MADKKKAKKAAKPLGKKDLKGTKGGLNFTADPPGSLDARYITDGTSNIVGKYATGKFSSP